MRLDSVADTRHPSPILRIWPLLLLALIVSGCMWPSSYSDKKSGRILDHDGKPLPGTYVFTRVNKECGSLGGRSVQVAKSSYTVTDDEGRYTRSISGTAWLSDMLLASCSGFSFDDFACRQGYGCSMIRNDGDFVLEPGHDLTFMLFELPPEIKSAVGGCPQKKWATSSTVPGWEPGVEFRTLWACASDSRPLPEIDPPQEAIGLIKYTSVSGKDHPLAVKTEWLSTGTYHASDDAPGLSLNGGISIELFALAERDGILRPIGGLRWGYGATKDFGYTPSPLVAANRYEWGNMLPYAKGQLPLDLLKRLPNSAPPP